MTELHKINLAVARHLRTIAQLYLIDDGKKHHFRIKTFNDAAEKIAGLTKSVTEVEIAKIGGIGKSVIEVVDDYVGTGTSQRLTELGQKWPVECLTMTMVDGIGPKTALKFHQDGIKDFDALLVAAQKGTIKERFVSNVLAAARKQNGRVPHETAKAIAESVIVQLNCLFLTVCGSLRRKTPDSKDIDIIACPEPEQREELLSQFCAAGEVINRGDHKATLRVTKYGVQMNVDLWIVEKWHVGAALVYATGSKDHCVALRSRAKSRGYTLNEYGIFPASCDVYNEKNQLAGRTEGEVYQFLELPTIVPENRTGRI